jgi:hypothetical protein
MNYRHIASPLRRILAFVCLVFAVAFCVDRAFAQRLYFSATDENRIYSASLDGSGTPSIVVDPATSGSQGPVGLFADLATSQLYIAGGNNSEIRTAPLFGGSSNILANSTAGDEHFDVFADSANSRYFYSTDNGTNGSLWVANTNGSGSATQLFSGSTGSIHGIDYSTSTDQLYLAEIRDDQITRVNADGSGAPTVLFDSTDGVAGPRGLEIDVAGGRVFWAQQGANFLGEIWSGNLDGSGTPTMLYQSSSLLTHDVILDPSSGLLYWTEFQQFGGLGSSRIMVGNADGTGMPMVLHNLANVNGRIRGIVLVNVPEPTGVLPLAGLMLVMARRRRRTNR